MRKLCAVLLSVTLLLCMAVPAFADGESSEGAQLLTYDEAFAQMTPMDYLILFGGFFGSMAIAMAVTYFFMKRKRKKGVDKYRRP